jgi:amino acid transporter
MPPGLRRDLGLWSAAAVVVGSMIGVGIFLGPRVVAQQLPTPGMMLLAWTLGGAFVLCGALTYAEMGAMLPRSGGSYNFIKEAYGPLPAFLSGWSGVAIGKAANVSALAVGFGETIALFLPITELGKILVAAAIVLGVALINTLGVRHAGRLSVAAMAVKIGALTLLVVGGLLVLGPKLGALATGQAPPGPSGVGLFSAFGLALIPVFFAYDGWENSTQVAEEVRDPQRNVPRSVVLGTLVVMALYVLANLVYLLAIGPADVGQTNAAAGRTADAIVPGASALVTVAILLSIVGTVNNIVLTGPRIAYVMGRDGLFPEAMGKVTRWGTPARAIALQTVISLALVLLPPVGNGRLFDTLLTYIIVDSFIFYALATSAVFVLRRTRPDAPRPFRVPLYPWVPAVFVVGSVAFILNAFWRTPAQAVVGVLIVLAGLPLYVYLRWRGRARRVASVSYQMAGR